MYINRSDKNYTHTTAITFHILLIQILNFKMSPMKKIFNILVNIRVFILRILILIYLLYTRTSFKNLF